MAIKSVKGYKQYRKLTDEPKLEELDGIELDDLPPIDYIRQEAENIISREVYEVRKEVEEKQKVRQKQAKKYNLNPAGEWFARVRAFDLICPECDEVYSVVTSRLLKQQSADEKDPLVFDRTRCLFTCSRCGWRAYLGILAWEITRLGSTPLKESTPADVLPTVSQSIRLRSIVSRRIEATAAEESILEQKKRDRKFLINHRVKEEVSKKAGFRLEDLD